MWSQPKCFKILKSSGCDYLVVRMANVNNRSKKVHGPKYEPFPKGESLV